MPNWITNKIKAPSHVIAAMVNTEGRIDFNTMAPFPGPVSFDMIDCAAEDAAETVLRLPLNSHPLIASLEAESRRRVDLAALRDDSFEQFVAMLRNYRACGYLHSMDFARKVWGTKWNACEPEHDMAAGTAQFDTAWACPEGVLIKLSERFPDEEISVVFADEDIGSNVGEFVLKAGQMVSRNVAPDWRDQSEDERRHWTAFANEVKGWEPEEEEQS